MNPRAVYLTSLRSIEEGKVSNRIQIREGYPYILRGRQFEIQIELTEGKNELEWYYIIMESSEDSWLDFWKDPVVRAYVSKQTKDAGLAFYRVTTHATYFSKTI